GIKQPLATMLDAAREHRAHAIGMSGLLVKSTVVMKENLEEMNRLGITLPVILGGAALTRHYVEHDLRAIYKGPLWYARDAFEGLSISAEVCDPAKRAAREGAKAREADAAVAATVAAVAAADRAEAATVAPSDAPRVFSIRERPVPVDEHRDHGSTLLE